ncbi:hypothetical protein [Fangia hongkongensis]|uniref:hypothetical protein n=1 Tax=Fangia hongkongensis TaxID=270495 RepID=UPI00035C4B53|nr:hypothetical protein [Fangia hongkongensis]MBK2125145.1 hypothetical protein [Fangia hongkongensis]
MKKYKNLFVVALLSAVLAGCGGGGSGDNGSNGNVEKLSVHGNVTLTPYQSGEIEVNLQQSIEALGIEGEKMPISQIENKIKRLKGVDGLLFSQSFRLERGNCPLEISVGDDCELKIMAINNDNWPTKKTWGYREKDNKNDIDIQIVLLKNSVPSVDH